MFESYDTAFFRRIRFHVAFKLPTHDERVKIWQARLSDKIPKKVSLQQLATMTDGLSGGDIENLIFKLCIKTRKASVLTETLAKCEIEKYKACKKDMDKSIILEHESKEDIRRVK